MLNRRLYGYTLLSNGEGVSNFKKTIADLILMNDPLNSTLFILERIIIRLFPKCISKLRSYNQKMSIFVQKLHLQGCVQNIYNFENYVNKFEVGFPEWFGIQVGK